MQRQFLDQFEERGIRKKKLDDGVQIEYAATKYWVKYDGEGNDTIVYRWMDA